MPQDFSRFLRRRARKQRLLELVQRDRESENSDYCLQTQTSCRMGGAGHEWQRYLCALRGFPVEQSALAFDAPGIA